MTWCLSILYGLLASAVYTDLRRHRIPNALTFGGAIAGIVLHTWFTGMAGFIHAVSGLAVGLAILLPLYLMGGMSAGDVKLLAAVGSLLGPQTTLWAGAYTLITGGISGLLILCKRRGLWRLLRRYGTTLKILCVTGMVIHTGPQPDEPAAARFPYAVAIALGTLAALSLPLAS